MLERYYRINQAAGIGIQISGNGNLHLHACTISADGKLLTIDKKIVNLDNVSKLKEILPAKTPVALNLSGKMVLQKKIERVGVIDQSVFGMLLPNSRLEDFYIQNFTSGESSFVSIIRRSEADKWIEQLKALGLQILSLSLGPFPLDNILPQLNIYDNECVIDGYQIKLNAQNGWTDCKYSESAKAPYPFKIESETINEHLLIPYAIAFQLVMGAQLDPIQAENDLLEKEFQKKISDNKLRVHGTIVLAFFFFLLLINFILFSWLNSNNAQLSGQVSSYAQNTSMLEEMNGQIQKMEGKLHTLGWDDDINKSMLIDQLCSILPPDVNLSEINISPFDQTSSRTHHSSIFYDRKIRLTGISQNIIPVNEWIARIKIRPWAKNPRLESFNYDNELNAGRFLITIDY